MSNYTIEELNLLEDELLNYMTQNNSTFEVYWGKTVMDNYTCFNKKPFNKKPLDILIKIIRHLVSGKKRRDLNRLIFSIPIEKMPLYLNTPDYLGIFARWRLKIGR
jgi:hypothetical protein